MKILALDTSTEFCSAAVWAEGRIAEREALAGQRHSELLLGMVDEVLGEAGIGLPQLDGIAYGKGPGSFTGLRIACGVTQGLAFAQGLPVVGVSTLLAMAAEVDAEHVVCALDARMKEIYWGAYAKEAAGWNTVQPPGLYAPHGAPLLPPGEWVACGSGFETYRALLEERYRTRIRRIVTGVYPRARHIAQLSLACFVTGDTVSAERAAPFYLRDKVALRTDERAA
jgi:tRNA threonylcarbamoyladenosine biosynthesis protein TsaB